MSSLPLPDQNLFDAPPPRKQFHLDRDTKIGLGIMGAILLAVFFLTSRTVENATKDTGLARSEFREIQRKIEDAKNTAQRDLFGETRPGNMNDREMKETLDEITNAQNLDKPMANIGDFQGHEDDGGSFFDGGVTAQNPGGNGGENGGALAGPTPKPGPNPGAGNVADAGNFKIHVVQSGDNLTKISNLYFKNPGKVADIQKANNMTDGQKIVVGQKLKIPFPAEQAGAGNTSNPGTNGGTLIPNIKPPVTDKTLAGNPRKLDVGRNMLELNPPTGAKVYTVEANETLSIIARKLHGNTNRIAELRALNPNVNWDKLRVGTTIYYK